MKSTGREIGGTLDPTQVQSKMGIRRKKSNQTV